MNARTPVAALLAVGILGCEGPDARRQESPDAAAPVESVAERGPVRFAVAAGPGEVTVGQKLSLTLTAVADDGVEVQLPEPDETLGPFTVRRRSTPPDVPDGDTRRWTHTYALDTFTAGDAQIPPLTLTYVDRRQEGRPIEGELVSDPLTIMVTSVLAADEAATDFRDIKSPVDVPVERPLSAGTLAGLLIAAAAVAAVVAGIILLRRRRRAAPVEMPVPPDVWARSKLQQLAARRLLEQERFAEFYFALSDVVRQYIERRFRIMAPEQTTGEFLRDPQTASVLGEEHRKQLGGFLRAADMVKFALHRPTVTESEAALAAAGEFVDRTAPDAGPGAEPRPVGREAAA